MIERTGNKKKFTYLWPDGSPVTEEGALERIRKLRIPPAWTGVAVSISGSEKVQAWGFDKKGRKQYIYHPEFLEKNNRKKFARLRRFVTLLPFLREETARMLCNRKWCREKTLAVAVKILDTLSIRIGNECYRKENGSVGLTTLEKQHLVRKGGKYFLSFRGKSGKDHMIEIQDQALAKELKRLTRLPGERLLQYRDDKGMVRSLKAEEVNRFLKSLSGESISAKDFRTWKGTVMAVGHAQTVLGEIKGKRRKLVTEVVRRVSAVLGNTLAICRSYYIHPSIMKMLEESSLPARISRIRNKCSQATAYFSADEHLAAGLLFRNLS